MPAIWFLGTSYEQANLEAIDAGDTAWMVVASAFVLLMTPGLAFFYGGMVLTGVLAEEVGLVYGTSEVFVKHLAALVAVAVATFGLSYGLFVLVNAAIPMRVTEKQEKEGLDGSQHGE